MSAGQKDEISRVGIENDTGRYSDIYEALPLHRLERSIRVLHLKTKQDTPEASLSGELKVVALSNHADFAALSYVWGKDSDENDVSTNETTKYSINCNSLVLRVTRNCYDALTSIRDTYGSISIWVDSICIDQQNEEEKISQIRLMTDIYASAQIVYIWLGPGSIETERAIEYLAMASEFRLHTPGIPWEGNRPKTGYLDMYRLDMIRLACSVTSSYTRALIPFLQRYKTHRLRKLFNPRDLKMLLDNEWIQRAWTYQEGIFSSNPVIVCGQKNITWSHLQNGLDCIQDLDPPFRAGAFKLFDFLIQWALSDTAKKRKALRMERELGQCFHIWTGMHMIWLDTYRQAAAMNDVANASPAIDVEGNGQRWSVADYQNRFIKPRRQIQSVLAVLHSICLILPIVGVVAFVFVSHGETEWVITSVVASTAALLTCMLFYPNYNRWDDDFRDSHSQTQLLARLVYELRERRATEPADKAFALHEVFKSLDIQMSLNQPEIQGSVGKVYCSLFINILRQDTTFINLLIDVDGPGAFPDVPTWVPDWRSSHENNWRQSDFIYTHGHLRKSRDSAPQLVISENELSTIAIQKGIIREPLPDLEMTKNTNLSQGHDEASESLLRSFARCVSETINSMSCEPENFQIQHMDSAYKILMYKVLRSRQDREMDFKALQGWLERSKTPACGQSPLFLDTSRDDNLMSFMARCYRPASGRVPFITVEGFYGTGPSQTAAGDRLVWLKGMDIPMILRPIEGREGKFHVVGPAVVPGLMDLSEFNKANSGVGWEHVCLL